MKMKSLLRVVSQMNVRRVGFFSFCVGILCANVGYSQTPNANSVVVRVPKEAIQDTLRLDTIPYQRMNTVVSYQDGIGRTLQNVIKQGSPQGRDVILPYVYDNLGRDSVSYLPYVDEKSPTGVTGNFRATAVNDQKAFYNPSLPGATKIATDVNPYSRTVYEPSPLSRVVEQGFDGSTWQPGTGHTAQNVYQTNNAVQVSLWTLNNTAQGGAQGGQAFRAGSLNFVTTYNEDHHYVDTYTDYQGRVVLKEFERPAPADPKSYYQVYYVYDDVGRLVYVLTPGAITRMAAANSLYFTESATDSIFNEHVYAYHYDDKGRVIMSKAPGQGWTEVVYNTADQVVLTRDSLERAQRRWEYIKYDRVGRVVVGGFMNYGLSRSALQTILDGFPVNYEHRTTDLLGYSNNAYPMNFTDVNLVNYYDDYDFNRDGTPNVTLSGQPFGAVQSLRNRNLLTGSIVKNDEGKMLQRTYFYDDQGRLIETVSDNTLSGKDTLAVQLDFEGKVVQSQHRHKTLSDQVVIGNKYQYDPSNRLTASFQQMNKGPWVRLAGNEYNELSQLVRKTLHSLDNGAHVGQGVDYRFNIRGWLANINNSALANDGGATNSDTNDLFGMSFNYDKPVAINGATVASLYGGNISSVSWKASTSGTTLPASTSQAYAFTYDSRDNLTTASYASVSSGGAYNVNAGKFNENISYDVMGNITYLNRNGASGTGQATIDNLTYTYYQGGSRLAKVADNAPAATRDQGFKDGTNTGPDYAYDGNGNLTQDNNKLISTTYNRLNLPVQITSGSNKIVYYYNFLGEKYKKEVYTGSTVTDTRYYLDEIEYKNNAIDFVHTSEGRAIKNGTSYYYEYALTDQTGSTRVTFADRGNNGKISTEQIGAYYPYGLQYSDPNQTRMTSPQNLYTYQGNETQQDLNINLSDFNARQYDPALGRFLSHDPDDQFADLSPYAAFGNNPINNVDPSGRSFFDLAVGLAGLGAVIGGIADGSSSGKGFFAGLAAGFIAGIVGREGIGGITSIGLNLGTGGYNDLGSSKGFFGKTQKTLEDLASKVPTTQMPDQTPVSFASYAPDKSTTAPGIAFLGKVNPNSLNVDPVADAYYFHANYKEPYINLNQSDGPKEIISMMQIDNLSVMTSKYKDFHSESYVTIPEAKKIIADALDIARVDIFTHLMTIRFSIAPDIKQRFIGVMQDFLSAQFRFAIVTAPIQGGFQRITWSTIKFNGIYVIPHL